jgi:ligand-binding sensor domain-containing protein
MGTSGSTWGAFRWNERLLTAWTNGLDRVHAIAVATNGVIWFGTAKGLFRSENNLRPPLPVEKRGVLSGRVWSLLFDRDGLLWIGTDNGVARFDGRAWSGRRAMDCRASCVCVGQDRRHDVVGHRRRAGALSAE